MTPPIDPEIKAMNAIIAGLSDSNLTDAMRERILKWVKERYEVEPMMRKFIKAAEEMAAIELARAGNRKAEAERARLTTEISTVPISLRAHELAVKRDEQIREPLGVQAVAE